MKLSFSPRIRRVAALFAVGAAMTLAFAGASSRAAHAQPASDRLPSALVGKVRGTDALIGLVTDGNRVLAYVCDSQYNSVWFRGEISSASAANILELRADGAQLILNTSSLSVSALEQQNVSVSGIIELAGASASNVFEGFRAQSNAGIFRAEATSGNRHATAGWIVDNDGDLRGGAAIREFQNDQTLSAVVETFGLDATSINVATLEASIPDFGIVSVSVVDITNLGSFFPDAESR